MLGFGHSVARDSSTDKDEEVEFYHMAMWYHLREQGSPMAATIWQLHALKYDEIDLVQALYSSGPWSK